MEEFLKLREKLPWKYHLEEHVDYPTFLANIRDAVNKSEQVLQHEEKGANYARKVALEILIILCNHGIVKTMMNVEELQQQLQEKKVTIGILGRHSMGKTTLINALLHGRYLPTSRVANTAVQVMIEHNEVESVLKMGSKKVAEGKQHIAEYIEGKNASASKEERQTGKNELLSLRLKIPLLSGAASTSKAVLMDTPGFMEAMRERATQIAHKSLKSSCAYLFVMSYEQMQDNGDAEILKQLQSFDKSFITDGRIVFAVTKFDNYYTGRDEEELSPVKTQEYVRDGLLALGFDVPLESIVPVSGKWALLARQLLGDPQQSMKLLKDAQRCLTYCKEKEARGEDESIDCHEEVRMEAREVAKELQEASQILDLEKRVKKIVSSCGDHLHGSVQSKVGGCITKTLDDLKKHSETMKKIIEECKTEMKRLCEIHQMKSKLSRAVDENEPTDPHGVKAEIERIAVEDSETAHTMLLNCLERQLKIFQHKYESTTRNEQYTPEMLDRDFPQLMSCQGQIDDAISNISFERTRRVYEKEVLMGQTSKDIWKLGDLLKQHFPPAGCEFQHLMDDARRILREVKREPLQLKDICKKPQLGAWTSIEKLKMLFRNLFCYRKDGDPAGLIDAIMSPGPFPRKEDIQLIVEKAKTAFDERCRDIFFGKNEVKDQMTEVVFASYCKYVSEKVEEAERLCPTREPHNYIEKLHAGEKMAYHVLEELDKLIVQLRNMNDKL